MADLILDDAQRNVDFRETNEAPAYPAGTQITLDGDVLRKLNIGDLPAIGTVFELCGECEVIAASIDPRQIESTRSITLQLRTITLEGEDTDNELDEPDDAPAVRPDAATRMFG
jgi:hypothetical protein